MDEDFRPLWHGVRHLAVEEQLLKNFKIIFKLGRNSLLRDMRQSGKEGESWYDFMRKVEKKHLDLDGVIAAEPLAHFGQEG